MIYRQLFDKHAAGKTVSVGVIGTGQYATAVVTQSAYIPELSVSAVCEVDIDAAKRAYERAGMNDHAVCDTRPQALRAIESGRPVIVQDADLLMELPVDIVVESTGVPEAAAKHGAAAIEAGKHVAMVSKEADAAVGPILKRRADDAELVYSAVDGDQHGLLISLVQWARDLGLHVYCGGKAVGWDIVYDEATGTVSRGSSGPLNLDDPSAFAPGPSERAPALVGRRREMLGRTGVEGYDITEMTIVANATGLAPDVDTLRGPHARIPEIPEVLCPEDLGGILTGREVVECVTVVRGRYEADLGGGVFIVVGCENDYSRHILTSKGLIPNSGDTTALIYRPHHLCGVETPITLLTMGLLGVPTGATEYLPRYDTVARAREDLKAGDTIGTDHDPKLHALMRPAAPAMPGNAIPLHMASGCRLLCDLPRGTVLTTEMVEAPSDSALWSLRHEQDARFAV